MVPHHDDHSGWRQTRYSARLCSAVAAWGDGARSGGSEKPDSRDGTVFRCHGSIRASRGVDSGCRLGPRQSGALVVQWKPVEPSIECPCPKPRAATRDCHSMNPIVFAMRRPLTVMVAVVAVALGSGLALLADADRHLPEPQPAGHLRRPALRRHGPGPDGGAAHQLLRISLPLHRRHPPRREPEHPGHGPDEALLPPRHEHGPGDGRDDRLRHPLAGLHAAGDGLAVHHPVRRRAASRSATSSSRARPRSIGEIQDQALFKVRPMFASLPGVSAPPPFGGSQRTVVVRVDPDRLRSYKMSPDEVIDGPDHREHDQPFGQRPDRRRRCRSSRSTRWSGRSKDLEIDPDPARRGPRRLPPRRRHRAGRLRHPHRLRPGQRPPGRLHPRDQAGRRLDALGRRERQGGPPHDAGGPPRRHQGQLRVRPVADRHPRRRRAWRPRGRWARS